MSFFSPVHPLALNGTAPVSAPIVHGGQFIADILPTWSDLNQQRVRDLKSAVCCTARILGIPKENLLLECDYLNRHLKRGSIATEKIHPNVVVRLRYIVRRLGGHGPKSKEAPPLTSAWGALLKIVENESRRQSLMSFARYCSTSDVSPELVDADVLATFEVFLQSATLCNDPAGRARRTLATWNWGLKTLPNWPRVKLARKGMRVPYTFPLTTYPQSFQDEVERLPGWPGQHRPRPDLSGRRRLGGWRAAATC